MIRQKRGFELQFHWIFVLVAGGLIIAFFFAFAVKQRSVSVEKLSLTLSADVENILTSAYVSSGTAQVLPVPPQGIAFECSEGCDCFFRISRASRPFGGKVMFAPSFLEDEDLVVWSVPWNVPFRATNFLFVTNPLVKYFFVYDPSDSFGSSLVSKLQKVIPESVDACFVSSSDVVVNEGFSLTRFVFLNIEPYSLDASFKKADVSAVSVGPSVVTFYEKIRNKLFFTPVGTSGYSGLPMVLAAVFSNDAVMFECNVKSAFRRLSYVSGIYADRARKLQSLASSFGRVCVYEPSVNYLEDMSGVARQLSESIDVSALSRFSSLIGDLDRVNRDVIEQSCPELF